MVLCAGAGTHPYHNQDEIPKHLPPQYVRNSVIAIQMPILAAEALSTCPSDSVDAASSPVVIRRWPAWHSFHRASGNEPKRHWKATLVAVNQLPLLLMIMNISRRRIIEPHIIQYGLLVTTSREPAGGVEGTTEFLRKLTKARQSPAKLFAGSTATRKRLRERILTERRSSRRAHAEPKKRAD